VEVEAVGVAQNRIGWECFMQRFIAQQWMDAQKIYLHTTSVASHYDETKWDKFLVEALMIAGMGCYSFLNEQKFGVNKQESDSKAWRTLVPMLKAWYTTPPYLLGQFSFLFNK